MERKGIASQILWMRIGRIEIDPSNRDYYSVYGDTGKFLFSVKKDEIFDENGCILRDDLE